VRIAITGVSGLLGAHLATAFRKDHDVSGIDRNEWWGDWPLTLSKGDLQDKAFLAETIKSIQPDVLVHCAGTVNVDAAEKDPAEALDQNQGITQRLLQAVSPSCSFVYVSTDSVFSGDLQRWTEDQQPAPLNVHGKTKLAAERSVQQHARHLIIRTNFYGWSSGRKKTAAEWLHGALERQESITLFDDFFFTPIYAVDLAEILSRMVRRDAGGVFHVAGRDRVSKFEFGSIMAREMNVSMQRVKKGSIAAMPLEAPRSTEISLSSEKVQRFLGEPMPRCEEGVRRFLGDRNKPLSARFTHNA
jgi:dTDP-4-dehydrorhamnose reductase